MKQCLLITILMLSTTINAQKIKNVDCGDYYYSLPALRVELQGYRSYFLEVVGLEGVINDLENELIEADEEASAARINTDVLAAGKYNIAVVYFVMSEYDLAEIYLREAIQYGKFLRDEEYLQVKFVEDHMRRFNRSRNPR